MIIVHKKCLVNGGFVSSATVSSNFLYDTLINCQAEGKGCKFIIISYLEWFKLTFLLVMVLLIIHDLS